MKLDDEIDNFLRSPNERKPNQFVEKLKKSETTDEVHIETIHHDSSDDTTYDPDGEDVGEDVNEEVDEEMSEMSMSEFKKSFLEMRNNRKWYLKSGKCVEDELYAFGIKCRFEHLAHSFIIDPYDEKYIQYEIFTPEELEEIL
ncbi:16659_t:CDS:2 [Funneliformis caledonium]|uniref:16659_t:CDS:1 n=1 Tax=Funneliformis caledonium TaxID=1117310 RepID=A0A9N9N657_9GLOM|nr:16659_t:CDS:2 [Funneliformis caledonium]